MIFKVFALTGNVPTGYYSSMSKINIRQKTVVEQVMAQIKSLIASGAYKPGDKIPTEMEMAENFGVGRSSIREAVKIFNYLGVLESKTAKGTYVQERSHISSEALTWSLLLGNEELEEMIDLRGAIELWSIIALTKRNAAGLLPARKTVADLKEIVAGMEQAVAEGTYEELIDADFQFHLTIITSQENAQFSSLYQTLRSFLYGEMRESQDTYSNPALIPSEHNEIVRAIESGDLMTVLHTYTGHIVNTKQRIMENMQHCGRV